jgi:anti-anti-sigma regulatory factor
MANNFKFLSQCKRNRIHLKLYGDFDGSSAFELINALNKIKNGFHQIVIDTDNLNAVHTFGINVFNKNFFVLGLKINNIIVTGKHKFSLEKCH